MTVVFKKRLSRPRLGKRRQLSEDDSEEFEGFANIAKLIDGRAEVAAERAIERDQKVHRSRSRAWLERHAFTSRLATQVFHVQRHGGPVVRWPMEKVRVWLGRLGLERDAIDDIEYEVACATTAKSKRKMPS